MEITFSPAELEMFSGLIVEKETPEDVLHRLLLPSLRVFAEARLQRLADIYRQLSPDLQVEAASLLKDWHAEKVAEAATPALDLPISILVPTVG